MWPQWYSARVGQWEVWSGDLAGRYEATGAGEAVSAGGSGLEGPCTIRATKPIEHEMV